MSEIELSSLDLRYQGYRMRDRAGEARLLTSICERGIVEPLEGVDLEQRHVLLNGFKRWRCARQLRLSTAPYVSLGEDAALGIVALLRASKDRTLSLLEQAGFVDELKRLHGMNVAQIASGNVALPLQHLRQASVHSHGCAPLEPSLLKDIELAQKSMRQVMDKSADSRLQSAAFRAQAQLLLAGVLDRATAFFQSVRQLQDRCGQS
jgi:ParB-like chromosome segregation protein Spo0J